ncbi:MAG: glutamate--tRNA ligase [Myxococcota bacterium]
MPELRVRFAPSPTGYLHIGGARTALYNWLWARRQGGTFVLRLEDTDAERSTPESVQTVLDALRWLGLDWDEGPEVGGDRGPYFQSQRLDLYREEAERLIRTGHAYRCYCTKEDLEEARRQHEASGSRQAFKYPGTCRDAPDRPEVPHVVRFKAPQTGATGWVDVVRGRIDVPNDAQQDFILLRADGTPLYNFGCVVDDLAMGITLVARGDDHIVNTPPQLLLYDAFRATPPDLAHLPMILAPTGEKLSKRHAAVSVLEYRDMGYLPDAVLNYLARIGWSHGDQEIFTREELVEKFDWEHVGRTAGRYDAKKFEHVQAEHLRMRSPEELARLAAPFLARHGLDLDPADPKVVAAVRTVQTRAVTLADIPAMIDFYFQEPPVLDDAAKTKFLAPKAAEPLTKLAAVVGDVEPFEEQAIEARVLQWLEEEGLKLRVVAQPARVAMTGRTRSPGLFEVMEVLGKDRVLARLEEGARIARAAEGG